MTRISNRFGAINFSQGFPDFDPPQAITDRLAEIALYGPHQYTVTWGAQNFREDLAKKPKRDETHTEVRGFKFFSSSY